MSPRQTAREKWEAQRAANREEERLSRLLAEESALIRRERRAIESKEDRLAQARELKELDAHLSMLQNAQRMSRDAVQQTQRVEEALAGDMQVDLAEDARKPEPSVQRPSQRKRELRDEEESAALRSQTRRARRNEAVQVQREKKPLQHEREQEPGDGEGVAAPLSQMRRARRKETVRLQREVELRAIELKVDRQGLRKEKMQVADIYSERSAMQEEEPLQFHEDEKKTRPAALRKQQHRHRKEEVSAAQRRDSSSEIQKREAAREKEKADLRAREVRRRRANMQEEGARSLAPREEQRKRRSEQRKRDAALRQSQEDRLSKLQHEGIQAQRQASREELRRNNRLRTTAARKAELQLSEVRAEVPLPPTTAPIPEAAPDKLHRLRTSGCFVVDENGDAVSLRGVTVQGLDRVAPAASQSLAEALSLDDANLSVLAGLWEVNVVRLPFVAQSFLSGNGALSAGDLLNGLDDLILTLSDLGIYTLLALQAPSSIGGPTAPLPDQNTLDCWTLLAPHYMDAPAALFEVYSLDRPVAGDWPNAAQALIGTIRMQYPASVLFVGNGTGSSDTSGLPLLYSTGDAVPNTVYAIRVPPESPISSDNENLLAALTRSVPVFASDWSSSETFESDRSAEFAGNVFGRYGIGWSASSWNAEPRLVEDSAAHKLAPTRWGLAVQRAMAVPSKKPLRNLLPGEKEVR